MTSIETVRSASQDPGRKGRVGEHRQLSATASARAERHVAKVKAMKAQGEALDGWRVVSTRPLRPSPWPSTLMTRPATCVAITRHMHTLRAPQAVYSCTSALYSNNTQSRSQTSFSENDAIHSSLAHVCAHVQRSAQLSPVSAFPCATSGLSTSLYAAGHVCLL